MSKKKKKYTRNKSTAIERIREYYLDKRNRVELTPHQEHIRERLVAAHTLLTNFHSPSQAHPIHAARFGISDNQAWRDIRNAVNLFGDVQKAQKEGIRWIVYEYAVKTYQKAAERGDMAAMNKAVGQMVKVMGLDREDPEVPDMEKMKPSLVVLGLPEEQINQMQLLLQGGSVNFSKAQPEPKTIDADVEIVE